VFASFQAFNMPTTIYLDAEGNEVGRDNGAISESDLRNRIASLFDVES
jgi:hypothetical protein